MERILVALDGSPRAPSVLTYAVELARKVGGRLVLYRAVGIPVEIPTFVYSSAPGEVAGLLERIAKEQLAQLEESVPADLRGGTRTSIAIPWQGVCAAAQREKADLIVIGSHGYGGLDRLLGTTAAKIVNHADRPVLVVRGEHP